MIKGAKKPLIIFKVEFETFLGGFIDWGLQRTP